MWTRERNTPSPDRAPNQLPLLQRGHHRRPEDGACVMEYVSVLAGGKFTDHPRCTHPALATLARLVNDWIDDDEVRSELALLAPDLIDTGRGDLRTTQCVVASCLDGAAAARPRRPRPSVSWPRHADGSATSNAAAAGPGSGWAAGACLTRRTSQSARHSRSRSGSCADFLGRSATHGSAHCFATP